MIIEKATFDRSLIGLFGSISTRVASLEVCPGRYACGGKQRCAVE